MPHKMVVREFNGVAFTVTVHAETPGGYRLRMCRKAAATASHEDVHTSREAFELSRLLRLGASFIEWVEDYGPEAADEWPGQTGTAAGGQSPTENTPTAKPPAASPRERCPMTDYTTIHEFCGQSVRVAVRRHRNGPQFRVTIIRSCSEDGRSRTIEFECCGSREAIELFTLLKVAAVMAQHLEEGGEVELWSIN